MKRYRVFSMDFDSREMMLSQQISGEREPAVKEISRIDAKFRNL